MSKIYAPYIEQILPAFIKNNQSIIIQVPFEHHQTLKIAQNIGYALQIKDVLNNDELIGQVIKAFDEKDSAWSKNEVSFTIDKIRAPALFDKIQIGRFYKIALAYVDFNTSAEGEIGYWSAISIGKCTAISSHTTLTIDDNFTTSFTFPYKSANGELVDMTEKLYSVNFTLYNEYQQQLETSEEIIINHAKQATADSAVVSYTFNSFFNIKTFEEILNFYSPKQMQVYFNDLYGEDSAIEFINPDVVASNYQDFLYTTLFLETGHWSNGLKCSSLYEGASAQALQYLIQAVYYKHTRDNYLPQTSLPEYGTEEYRILVQDLFANSGYWTNGMTYEQIYEQELSKMSYAEVIALYDRYLTEQEVANKDAILSQVPNPELARQQYEQIVRTIYDTSGHWADTYYLQVEYKTINNYCKKTDLLKFALHSRSSNEDFKIITRPSYDNGLIHVQIKNILTQSSAPNNIVDLIAQCSNFHLLRKDLATQECIELCSAEKLDSFYYSQNGFQDLGIEHGKKYMYILKYSKQVYSEEDDVIYLKNYFVTSAPVVSTFEDMFLYDETCQLKLRFNPDVSSFKAVVPQSKVETIGGKFPFIYQNSQVNYKEFPISFLASYLEDEEGYFIKGLPDKYSDLKTNLMKAWGDFNTTRREEYVLNKQVNFDTTPTTSLTDLNIYNERRFKMAVLDWLNNGKPKVFKSPSEGNFIVRIINVSMSPEKKLGRMLHSFSGTAVEIDEWTTKNLQKYNFLLFRVPSNKPIVTPLTPDDTIIIQRSELPDGGELWAVTTNSLSQIGTVDTTLLLDGARIIMAGEDTDQ